LLMVDGLLFAGFRLRQSDSQLKPPPPSTSRLNSPYTTSDFSSAICSRNTKMVLGSLPIPATSS
ncbi:hypothetical protein, partial [Paraburkholderia phenoliruptrix]|uniref:hypothetical protein n=1 Tax=Paraburkholderia phenoliruptrix TaxID=252970 RepID=UPI001ABA731B